MEVQKLLRAHGEVFQGTGDRMPWDNRLKGKRKGLKSHMETYHCGSFLHEKS